MIDVDLTQFRGKIKQTQKVFEMVKEQSEGVAREFLEVIRQRTPSDSKETQKSWTLHIHKSGDLLLWEISPDGREEVVAYLEFGTKPHVILPKDKKALAFEVGGDSVVTKYVVHPGTKPLGIVRITQDEVDKSMEELVQRLHDKIRGIWSE